MCRRRGNCRQRVSWRDTYPSLVGGAAITETVFAVPGVGRLMIDSIFSRDYAVVQGLTMVLAVMVSVAFLAVDALQAMLDPRVGS